MNVSFTKWVEIDRKTDLYFSSHNNPRLRAVLAALTRLGTGALWVVVYTLSLILLPDHCARVILTLIFAELIGLMVIVALRYLTKRKRPIDLHRTCALTPWNRYSFPSHHTLRCFIIAVIVGADFPRLLPFLIVTASAVGFSRIYLSKHYLSDVVVGCLLGILLALMSQRFIWPLISSARPTLMSCDGRYGWW